MESASRQIVKETKSAISPFFSADEEEKTRDRMVYILDPYLAIFRSAAICGRDIVSEIRQLVGAAGIDSFALDHDHSLYFDDAGLKDGITHYSMVDGHPDPLVGRLIIASSGDTVTPTLSAQTALSRIHCYHPVMDPVIEKSRSETGQITVFLSAVTGFKLRIAPLEISIV